MHMRVGVIMGMLAHKMVLLWLAEGMALDEGVVMMLSLTLAIHEGVKADKCVSGGRGTACL